MKKKSQYGRMFVDKNQQTTRERDFFMESIQQIGEKFIRRLVDIDLSEGLTQGLEEVKRSADELICQVLEHKLSEMDQAIYESSHLRRSWIAERKEVPRELLTRHGLLQFSRRYYRSSRTGEYRYLLDDLVGVAPRERVEAGLVADLCETAADQSYAKSSQFCCGGEVSRQTVMQKTRQVQGCQLAEVEPRLQVPEIHIQADEDHVAMQDGRRDTIVKLVAIHEPARKVGKKRWQLPQRYLMSSCHEAVEDFWLRVADAIDRRYGERDNLMIYIHGDGANWIRSGTEWLKNSRFVLDKYHVGQRVNQVTGHNPELIQYIWDQFAEDDREKIGHLTEACINSDLCAESTGTEFMGYLNHNWDGIRIWYDGDHRIGGSCAEGLVSHVLSSRLSSRPCGWRDTGLETISRLRVHLLNGGRITPENIRRTPVSRIKTTLTLKKSAQMDAYDGTRILYTDHRSSAQYRLFKAITRGGTTF
jgi:hypothetical protein